jgi:hypothetical protein
MRKRLALCHSTMKRLSNESFVFIQHGFLNYVGYITKEGSLFKVQLEILWRNLQIPLKTSVRIAGIHPRFELRLS